MNAARPWRRRGESPSLQRDLAAEGADARHAEVIRVETSARWYTGAIRCAACHRELLPTEGEECDCAHPAPVSVSWMVTELRDETARLQAEQTRLRWDLDRAREEAVGLRAALEGALSRAQIAEATAGMVGTGVRAFVDQVTQLLDDQPVDRGDNPG